MNHLTDTPKAIAGPSTEAPPTDDVDDDFTKAIRESMLEAKKPRKEPEYIDDEEELRKIMEISKQEKRASKRTEYIENDDELRRAMEASAAGEVDEDEDFRRMVEESLKLEKEELKKAEERLAKEVKKAAKASERQTKEDERQRERKLEAQYKADIRDAKAQNKSELMGRDLYQQKHAAYYKRRERERKAEAEASRLAEIAERQRAAANEGRRLQDEDDPQLREALRQAVAQSLEQAPEDDMTVDGLPPGKEPPRYGDLSATKGGKLKASKYYVSEHPEWEGGVALHMTEEILQIIERLALRAMVDREEYELGLVGARAKGKEKPPPYPWDEVEEEEQEKVRKDTKAPDWNMANMMHGNTHDNVRQNVQNYVATADRTFGVRRPWGEQRAQGSEPQRANNSNALWNTQFAGIVPGQRGVRSQPRNRY